MSDNKIFDDTEARAAWNTGARAWHVFVTSGADYYRALVHGPALLAACQPIKGLRVLDLGCGQGYFSRELVRCGARVVGVDLSDELVALARAEESDDPMGIVYEAMPAQDVDQNWPGEHFDMVTACMSLQDMSDIEAALRAAHTVLRSGGRLVASVPHPLTNLPIREWERDAAGNKVVLKLDRYFDVGPRICRWSMSRLIYEWETPYWRYTLEAWSEMIADAGFLIRRLHEPCPAPEQVAEKPELDDCTRMPYFLILDLLKA